MTSIANNMIDFIAKYYSSLTNFACTKTLFVYVAESFAYRLCRKPRILISKAQFGDSRRYSIYFMS